MVEDLHLGQHPVGVAHEVPQQLELGGGELNLLPAAPYLVAFLVEFEVGEGEPGRRLDPVSPGAAEHGADPRDHLFQAERLGDVVVAAQREAADLVLGGVPGRQEDDRDAGATAPQPPDDVEAVHVRQHHVQHDQVRPVTLSGLYRLGSGCRR